MANSAITAEVIDRLKEATSMRIDGRVEGRGRVERIQRREGNRLVKRCRSARRYALLEIPRPQQIRTWEIENHLVSKVT